MLEKVNHANFVDKPRNLASYAILQVNPVVKVKLGQFRRQTMYFSNLCNFAGKSCGTR